MSRPGSEEYYAELREATRIRVNSGVLAAMRVDLENMRACAFSSAERILVEGWGVLLSMATRLPKP